jgi:opacity protein-like surface antigen
MIIPQKTGLWQKVLALGAVIGSALTGCVTGGSVGAFVGSHNPSSQKNYGTIIFDNSIETGIRGRIKTESDVEIEVDYSGHKTNWTDGFENDDLEASDLSVCASYPVWRNGKVSVNANAGLISRSETQTTTIIGLPGNSVEDRTSTGWKAGIEARWQPYKNVSVEAGLDFHGFSEGSNKKWSYEKSGTTLSVGASYNF